MSEILFDTIPSLDLHDFTKGNPEKRAQFVKDLGQAYENIGFVAIKNHGLSDELTAKLYDSIRQFFQLPDEVKLKYEKPELFGQRGYISKGKERAKGRNTGDLKEFFHVGQPQERMQPDYPENIWPSEVPDMETYAGKAFDTLQNAGVQMLRAISLHLGLDDYSIYLHVSYSSILLSILFYKNCFLYPNYFSTANYSRISNCLC